MEWTFKGGLESEKRAYGVSTTIPKSFTVIRSQETAHMIFYWKSIGVLQVVLHEGPREDFSGFMEEKQWESGNGGWMRL